MIGCVSVSVSFNVFVCCAMTLKGSFKFFSGPPSSLENPASRENLKLPLRVIAQQTNTLKDTETDTNTNTNTTETMAALTSAKNNLVKGMAPMEGLLSELLDREFITKEIYDRIKEDDDLAHYFKPKKAKAKAPKKAPKASPKKSPKDLQERNDEEFDEDRCSARKWESDGGLGYDNIQCSSCKKVSTDEAEKIMDEFKGKMDSDQLARLPEYLTTYDGCYCKNHLKQDFFMPEGWWLGKVQDDRPEKPVLPKGSFKAGYEADGGKEHRWMYGPSGEKNERISNRKPKKTKEVVEEVEVEVAVEDVEVAVEEVEVVAEVAVEAELGWCDDVTEELDPESDEEVEEAMETLTINSEEEEGYTEELNKDGQLVETAPPSDEVIEEEPNKDEGDHEDKPLTVDGVEYLLVWDDDYDPDAEDAVSPWMATYDDEHVGYPDADGGIDFVDEEEVAEHALRIAWK